MQSNPAFQSPTFDGDVSITGNFGATEASDLAKLINYGSLPVQLEELTVQNVSPTLGKDQLRAGIIAGVIGLVLVSIYMVVYYRILGPRGDQRHPDRRRAPARGGHLVRR